MALTRSKNPDAGAWTHAARSRPEPALQGSRAARPSDLTAKTLILLILAGLAVMLWVSWEDYLSQVELFLYGEEGSWSLALGQLSLWVVMGALLWRIALAALYRPQPPAGDHELPRVTVVVPAYNEGAQVMASLRSLCQGDYPRHKLQIVAVDDGSTDDTWLWMRRAARRHPGCLELVKLPVNRGKRHALYQGFMQARGEILVTVDSDSEVAPDGLRQLVTPMVRDPRVGAVAGNVRVLNLGRGVIPKMMDVAFTYSFDFIRAGQSRVNTVMTTPGALAAYRLSAVAADLGGWLQQRFLGRPANIGEDRALTNLALKNGYYSRFARAAVVRTEVPASYRALSRMLLRWARSNVRETVVMCRFAFTPFRQGGKLGARVNLFIHLYRMSALELLKVMSLVLLASHPVLFGYNFVLGMLLGALIPALVYIWRRHSTNFLWAFPYALFCTLGLSWISLWALFTPHRTGWLTRGLGGRSPRTTLTPVIQANPTLK
jgi:hyaluronan synthase